LHAAAKSAWEKPPDPRLRFKIPFPKLFLKLGFVHGLGPPHFHAIFASRKDRSVAVAFLDGPNFIVHIRRLTTRRIIA